MNIQFCESNSEVTELLRAHADRRIGLVLGRFGARIAQVIVRLSDCSGPRGDIEKRCQIDVSLRPRSVRAEDTHADPFTALNGAVDRVSRAVTRLLQRERASNRTQSSLA